jgi:hypothetical protein
MQYTVKPVYNKQPKLSLKASFRYNQSIYKEIYAIGENYVLRYKWEFVITEFIINGFNCKCRFSLFLLFPELESGK